MNAKLLVKRLRQLRESSGWTQQDVAEKIGLTRTAITQTEAGKRNISTFELAKFAELYQKPVSFFLTDSETDELDVVLFRAAPAIAKDKNLKLEVDRYLNLCKEGSNLQRLLKFPSYCELPTYSSMSLSSAAEANREGAAIAEQERKRLALGSNPLANIAELLSKQGIWMLSAELPKDISSLFLNHSETGLIILVNAVHSHGRRRFSYAHEYAHALLDRSRTVQVSSKKNNSELIEKRANAFAAAFLMPAQGIADILKNINKGRPGREIQITYDASGDESQVSESRLKPFAQKITWQDVATIAHHFGVSYDAAAYRLRGLNCISQKESLVLLELKELGRDYLRLLGMLEEDKKSLWDQELRSEILRLALEAYRLEEISRGKLLDLADMLKIDAHQLFKLIDV